MKFFRIRVFNLSLEKTSRNFFFNQEFELDHKNVSSLTDYLNLYEGWLIDEPRTSRVKGILVNDSFYGTIESNVYGKLFLEPSRRFYKNNQSSDDIIYHEDDVDYEHVMPLSGLKSQNNRLKSLLFADDGDKKLGGCFLANRTIDTLMYSDQSDGGLLNRTEETEGAAEGYSIEESEELGKYHWTRRSGAESVNETERLNFPDHRSVCNMYLKVDPFLYDEVYNNEGNEDAEITARYLLFFLNKQVEFLNDVFGSVKFFDVDNKKYYQGIKFMIHRTKVSKIYFF